jgi:hypothetical protein
MRCVVVKDEAMTLSRFRRGFNDAIRKELVLRGIDTLDQAYTLVQDYELNGTPKPQKPFFLKFSS